MSWAKDLSGQTFGELTVLSRSHRSPGRCNSWNYNCICSCGKTVKARSSVLTHGLKTKCGGKKHLAPSKVGTYTKDGDNWKCTCGKIYKKRHYGALPECSRCKRKKEEKNKFITNIKKERDSELINLRKQGLSVNELCSRFKISRQRVDMILYKYRKVNKVVLDQAYREGFEDGVKSVKKNV